MFPIPRYNLLDELVGASWFINIDLRSGYYHIWMTKGDEQKTALKSSMGCIIG